MLGPQLELDVGGTCFCVSMATGPNIEEGFDLALTEVIAPNEHCFVTAHGSHPGY